jgi:hypothetical protein
MKIPLRTTEQLFSLYELIALPAMIAEGKFIKYLPEYPFFGLSLSRRDYVLLSAAEVHLCSKGSLRVCPVNAPLYSTQTPSCEARLFFQTLGESNTKGNARKSSLRKWLIHNATSCSITTKEIRTLPELRRTNYTRLDTPAWYAPDLMLELTPEEPPRDKEDLPAAICELDDINGRLATPLRSLDVDTLRFHIRRIFGNKPVSNPPESNPAPQVSSRTLTPE